MLGIGMVQRRAHDILQGFNTRPHRSQVVIDVKVQQTLIFQVFQIETKAGMFAIHRCRNRNVSMTLLHHAS